MKTLWIAGAGGFGREVFGWARQHPDCDRKWRIGGFLDDNPRALEGFDYPAGVAGPISGHRPEADALYVCAIGQPPIKRRVCEGLRAEGARFLTLVHPSVILGPNVTLGEGVVLCPRVTLTADIAVGAFVCVNCHSSAGHDVTIGDWATISGHCDLTGGASVGEGAFLGSGVRLLPGKSVGAGAVAGAGSVVLRSVPAGRRVFGNLAKPF